MQGAHRGDAAYRPVTACHLYTYRHTGTHHTTKDGTSTGPKQQAGQRVPPAAAITCHTEHAVAVAATQAGVQGQQQSSSMRTTASSEPVRGHEQTGQRSNAGGSSTSTGVSARKGWARSHIRQRNGGQGEQQQQQQQARLRQCCWGPVAPNAGPAVPEKHHWIALNACVPAKRPAGQGMGNLCRHCCCRGSSSRGCVTLAFCV